MKNPTILIAEDHPIFREALAEKFLQHHFSVLQACDGEEAIKILRLHSVDFLLLDIRMPKLDGLGVLKQLKESSTPLPKTLMLSSFDIGGYIKESIENGADGYVLKDISFNELLRAIDHIAEGNQYIQQNLTRLFVQPDEKGWTKSDPSMSFLSRHEQDILKLICKQRLNAEIAAELSISPNTVLRHKQNIKSKIGAKTLIGCVAFALKHGIIDLAEISEA